MKSYREWKNNIIEAGEDLNVARGYGQGMAALKDMNPSMMAFSANLTRTLAEIESSVPGFTRKFVNKMITTLNMATDVPPQVVSVLRTKLQQAIAKLPAAPAEVQQQQQQQPQQ